MDQPVNATLHTAIIQTSRMNELADFYGRGLELGAPRATDGDHLGFQLPNAYFGFDQVEQPGPPGGAVSLWFEVADLPEAFARFQALGAKVKYPPRRMPWGASLAAFYDPDGNVFGLSQRGENPGA